MNIEVVIASITGFLIPNSFAICGIAGAIIDDAIGVMKVYEDTTVTVAHFFFKDQLK